MCSKESGLMVLHALLFLSSLGCEVSQAMDSLVVVGLNRILWWVIAN
jgi:hypothetical protein